VTTQEGAGHCDVSPLASSSAFLLINWCDRLALHLKLPHMQGPMHHESSKRRGAH
jgi:hypothetical protein